MSSQVGIGGMIRFSWAKSLEILLPFNFSRWFKILIIVWLAMAGIHGCSINFNIPGKTVQKNLSKTMTAPQPRLNALKAFLGDARGVKKIGGQPSPTIPDRSKMQSPSISADTERIAELRESMGQARAPSQSKRFAPFIAMIAAGFALFMLCLFFFLLWLFSRFSFVFLDVLATRKVAIAEPFKKHKAEGNSFFKWSLLFLASVLGVFLLAGVFSIPIFLTFKANITLGILWGIVAVTFFVLLGLAASIIWIVAHDFALPIMYRNKVPAMTALKQLWGASTFRFSQLAKYLLVVLGLWVVAGIIQSIVGIIVALGGLIAGGLVALPGILLLKMIPLLKIPLIILGILLAIALIFAVIIAIGLVMLPIAVFVRTFALTYLTRLYPECDLLNFSHKQP